MQTSRGREDGVKSWSRGVIWPRWTPEPAVLWPGLPIPRWEGARNCSMAVVLSSSAILGSLVWDSERYRLSPVPVKYKAWWKPERVWVSPSDEFPGDVSFPPDSAPRFGWLDLQGWVPALFSSPRSAGPATGRVPHLPWAFPDRSCPSPIPSPHPGLFAGKLLTPAAGNKRSCPSSELQGKSPLPCALKCLQQ